MMTYQEAAAYIEEIPKFSVKHSNEHTRLCLKRLGDPDRRIGAVIHVAGTNGKGSVCAFLDSALRRAGVKTALFTSPHLVRLNERIAVDGAAISDEAFLRVFSQVKETAVYMEETGMGHPSYFEFLFLMAMVHFAACGCEAAVIETGLGGRLDATNSIVRPALSVITSISFDHMQYLGETIQEIASEKAGIIKPGVPCVYEAKRPEAASVIENAAAEKEAPCFGLAGEDCRITAQGEGTIDFSTAFRYDGRADFRIRSWAPYQVRNAALAVLALKVLREHNGLPEEKLPDGEAVRDGLLMMRWPARMEQIRPGVFLDGAHNEDGIRAFIEAAGAIRGGRDAHLLFAVVHDKNFAGMIRSLASEVPWADVTVTEVSGSRRESCRHLQQLFIEAGQKNVKAVPDFREACRDLMARKGDGLLFICGSLYLAGEIETIKSDD